MLVVLVWLLLITGCNSTSSDFSIMPELKLEKAEIKGIRYYQSGNYEKAYEQLKEPAAWGYKGSQYLMAFMFLKGLHVEQSTLTGMAWLGVAKEAKVEEWLEQFDSFYAAAPKSLQAKIDIKVAGYIDKYGLKAQRMTCNKKLNRSTKRIDVKCHSYGGMREVHDIEQGNNVQ
ncbi:hypothetical protein BGP78_09915 [Pseudoalteromonas sp. MSK9-3]|nr:hypothetical protein BGP78_09915 [Pseudoalteromonas sp. MSK9-3]